MLSLCRRALLLLALGMSLAVAGLAPGRALAQPLGPDPYFSSAAATLAALQLLPLPPAPGTAAQAANVQLLQAVTATATPQMTAAALWDSDPSVFDFSQVLGQDFNAKNLPAANAFFTRVALNIENTNINLDRIYNSQGPVSPASYPSAHTLLGLVDGMILADMVPEKRGELVTYGVQYGLNRLILGQHWPADVGAGQMEAGVVLLALRASPSFQSDFDLARAEVRARLGLR
ncbi:Major phosphate-irrepressible acid phosphatase [Fundidesulfovibrio magnetotacticus]|uniref:Acid phosphatase n=1 Tax=Fundidesulfovibrio magnetotacticus TaxID=2730080 RepID=A0A6V8LQ72_9BACT|nr:phosphatase PAP2 family protein [Fundidesulfovibrio magnetotacticus]GFK93120.1 Major phosphate-irrepressible acid phosphatase [Fundidesulfovibrio magnetotacticus]